MKIDIILLNCFWLIVPLLIWNVVLGPRIVDPRVTSDAYSPAWLREAENVTRVVVFAFPLLLPLEWADPVSQAGLAIYLAGTLVYFSAWLPLMLAPHWDWSNSAAGLLAPRLTPFLAFLGIALTGHSWLYGILSVGFIGLHTWHGLQNLRAVAAGNSHSLASK